jgi:CNT family concentrative nucleoside transporter
MERFLGLFGVVVFTGIAFLLSRNRKAIHWRTIAWALVLQTIFAVVVLKGKYIGQAFCDVLPWPHFYLGLGSASKVYVGLGWIVLFLMFVPYLLRRFANYGNRILNWCLFGVISLCLLWGNLIGQGFERMRQVVSGLMAYSGEGASFVFGALANPKASFGLVFAFVVLPTIIFVASIFAVLYYLGVMQWIVGLFARVLGRFLNVSGAESVSVAASIFMGQTEAPLTIRPYLSRFTLSELMVIMTSGMAHVSGAIIVTYVLIANVDIVHLLTAVIMTAPGAIMMAKLMEPETATPETAGDVKVDLPLNDANILDAAARGAGEGGHLAFNVAIMLVAFIALVALANGILKALHPSITLEVIMGTIFKPLAFLMGVPWQEAGTVGALLGKRMVVNEFVAFADLGQVAAISTKAKLVATFALCGFANFSSIAIQIGGIGALIPERRGDLARLGFRAMIAGTLANFLSASIAGILVS